MVIACELFSSMESSSHFHGGMTRELVSIDRQWEEQKGVKVPFGVRQILILGYFFIETFIRDACHLFLLLPFDEVMFSFEA